jgi:hypothetical protein
MVGFGIRDGHVSAIREVDGARLNPPEFGSETASEAGAKGYVLGVILGVRLR